MSLGLYFWLAAALVALGLGMLVFSALSVFVDITAGGIGLFQRRWKTQDVSRLLGIEASSGNEMETNQDARRRIWQGLLLLPWVWAVFGVVLALLSGDTLLSPALLVIANVAGVLYRSQRRQKRMGKLNQDTSELILQFAARYPVSKSISASLTASSAQLPEGSEVRKTADDVVRRLHINQGFDEAIKPFSRLPVPILQQFGMVIAASQETSPAVFSDSLEMLRADVENRRDLHNLSRQSLTLTRSTARVLQAVLTGALIFVALSGNWRAYFVALPSNTAFYLAALGAGALGSLYIEAEINQLEI